MEKLVTLPREATEFVTRPHYELDDHEKKLATAQSILRDIATTHSFNNMAHYLELNKFMEENGVKDALSALKEWPYSYKHLTEKHSGGNCIDLAYTAQERLADSGINTLLIPKRSDRKLTVSQRDHSPYQHVLLLYPYITPTETKYYIFEPGWHLPYPMPLEQGTVVTRQNLTIDTVELTDERAVQHLGSIKGDGYKPRVIELIADDQHRYIEVQKQIMRIPRELEWVSKLEEGNRPLRITYSITDNQFGSNVKGAITFKDPQTLSKEHIALMSKKLGTENVLETLSAVQQTIQSFPNEFFVE